MKKIILCLGGILLLISSASCGLTTKSVSKTSNTTSIVDDVYLGNNTVWKEVQISDSLYEMTGLHSDFDPQKLKAETDYIFSGTVIDRKEFEVRWVDENGENWGPYLKSVIEVEVTKEYYGKSPVNGNTIKIYYPHSLSATIRNSFPIAKNNEYIFITRALDEDYVKEKIEKSPDDKFEQEKHADVYISNLRDNIMLIDKDNVAVYDRYFIWNDESMKKIIPKDDIVSKNIFTSDIIKRDDIIFFDRKDFDNLFSKLFIQQNYLPDADGLNKMYIEQTKTNIKGEYNYE